MKHDDLVSSLSRSGDSPRVLVLLVLVEQRLDALVFLERRQLGRVGELEEGRRVLDEPLGVDGSHLAHVLLRRLDDLVIDDPLRLPMEQRRRRMDGDHLGVHQRPVALRWILLGCVPEKSWKLEVEIDLKLAIPKSH